jgi:hypothetical protein
MATKRKMTMGVIVGNRGFFPRHLATSGREEMIRVLQQAGIDVVVLSPQDSKHGAVETYEEAKRCAALFRKHAEQIDAGCWSHARRKFVEAEKTAPEIAREAVDLIGRLFRVEKQAKDMSVAERLALRQTQSAAVLAELRQKLLAWKEQLLPKHPMAEAVNYTLGQWEELTVFTSDGAVPIDNNVSEREMKRVVLNRKNSLFVGNPRGGRTAAILASLTSSCRRHEMDPQLYFMQLLMNLPSWPANDIDAWLPDRWKQAHAARCAALEIPPLDS